MSRLQKNILGTLAGIMIITIGYGCTDEKIVFRDRDLFEDPVEAAQGMLGYADQDSKLTVCGNCHVGVQKQWSATAHADAWDGLQDSGHAQAFCEGCHTVNELGNTQVASAGYNAAPDARYHDVQCESCHGPGLAHVQDPNDSNVPLAAMTVGLDNTAGCGECHQGTHHPFTEQWEMSGHATLNPSPAGRAGCNGCHEGGGILRRFGENTNYIEGDELFPITCAVCHDPHGSENDAQLRFPIGGVAIEDNLCSQCHDRRSEPDPGSSHGLHPHAPETGLLRGDVGWFPPGLAINRGEIVASHGTDGNPRLCATCHVSGSTVTDAATGEFTFQAVGHGFNAIPCKDANGVPTTGDCGLNLDARQFQGCATAGCHSTEQGAFSALTTATARLKALSEDIERLLGIIDPNGEGSGGAVDSRDGVFTVAEGAFFNKAVAQFGHGDGRVDGRMDYASAAAHNPFLIEQLLIASIQALEKEYNVQAAPALSLHRQLGSY